MTAHQKRTARKKIDVRVTYGLGGSVFGQFPRDRVAGMSARELIQLVIDGPQPPGSAARTAKVLADVLRTQRMIDAELTRAAGGQGDGDPISLEQVVVEEEDGEEERESRAIQDTEEITVRLSEAYKGGRRW